ncbi:MULTISPECIES: iron reductase [Pseudofrankia]|uniref:iron reductase n=1 Tax=Pseudofrankia TaxID=2994363 RepID=UPI000234C86E|nr:MULTISPECIES: iron reductase [Pseudofrankia]OHV34412.1 iron reductase [Pseudofrankia sp. EUN1h]
MRGAAGGGDSPAPSDLGARFGPYFALDVLTPSLFSPPAGQPPAGWLAVADLCDPRTGAFARRAGAVRAALAAGSGLAADAVDERVAVSVAQLGVCARLVAPALALTVTTGHPPRLRPELLYWRDKLGGPFPLALGGPLAPAGAAVPGAAVPGAAVPGRLARGFVDGVLLPVVAPLVSAIERHHPVSSKILWGNVASGVAGAAKMIGLAEPALAAGAWGVAGALCAGDGPLRGAGGLIAPARFRRRSCCLIYRLDPRAHGGRASRTAYRNALCEDCVLHRP